MNYTFSDKINPLKPSAIREILKFASNPDIIPFAAGNPAPESFPVDEMAQISADIFKNSSTEALQYSITEGYAPLIEKLKIRNKQKFNVGRDFDSTIVVSGGQQGTDLSCKVLCNEGDTVLCENPSFIGCLNAFRSYNVNLVGIDMEDDGIDVNKLEAQLKTQKNIKLLYVIPTFQNPSGKVMSLEKRKKVYELCKKYGVIIIEDNPYGELRFAGEDIPSIKSMDEDGIVIYVGSFSKILSAGMRVGFVVAPNPIIQKIVVAKQVNDVHTNIFFQILVNKYLEQCDIDKQVAKVREIYKRKSGLMMDGINKYFDKRVKVIPPQGGLFLWCEFPDSVDVIALAKASVEKKVAVVPGNAFLVDESAVSHAIRLNYSTPSDSQIIDGIKILSGVIDEFLKK